MITYFFLALLIAIIFWRLILPGLKFESTHTTGALMPGTAPVAGGGTATATTGRPSMVDRFKSNLLTVLLVIVGGGVVIWGIFHPVRLSDTARLWEYWFSFVVLWGVLAALIALNAKEKAKTLQTILAGIMVTTLVIMTVAWVRGDENPSSQSSQGCPLFSSKVSKCMITKKKVVVTADQLTSAGEFEFCAVVPDASVFHIVQIRTNTLEMWSSDGEFPAEYKMIKHNDLVNGKCPNRF
ncbi:MAG: hypothetical protein Q8P23_02115 [bacterium]|nr:hypothetical protein [bacterium]